MTPKIEKIITKERDQLLNNIAENIINLLVLVDEATTLKFNIPDFINIPTANKDIILDNYGYIEKLLKKSIFGRGYNAG